MAPGNCRGRSEESIPKLVLIQMLGSGLRSCLIRTAIRASLVVREEIGRETVRDFRRQSDEMTSPVVGVGRANDKLGVDQSLNQSLSSEERRVGQECVSTFRAR